MRWLRDFAVLGFLGAFRNKMQELSPSLAVMAHPTSPLTISKSQNSLRITTLCLSTSISINRVTIQ